MLERMWGKGKTPALLVGVQTVQPFWISVWQFLRKLGNNLPQDPAMQPQIHSFECNEQGKVSYITNNILYFMDSLLECFRDKFMTDSVNSVHT